MLKILFQEICKLNIKWDDNIGVLVNKWNEIVKSLASSEIIYFKLCFYLHDIQFMLQLFILRQAGTKYGNISATFVTSKSRIVPLNKSITTSQLELLENLILSNLIRSVYNSLSEKIFIKELMCWGDSLFHSH